jgi:2-keto-4-pentenoate hydratase/2-oxohepta-3-ene-1,7-dioic acid hydratase in catechol pathway
MRRAVRSARPLLPALACMATLAGAPVPAAQPGATPFKLGTFEAQGREFIGLVLRDEVILDIAAANAAFERANPAAPKLQFPADLKEVIARYDAEFGPRLRALAAANANARAGGDVRAVSEVKVLPPVRPTVMLNAGANYPEHAAGIIQQAARGNTAGAGSGVPPAGPPRGGPPAGGPPRTPAQSAPGIWERQPGDTRGDNPYLFLKSPTTIVGAYDDVIIPRGRDQIDWECEFSVVVGRTAKNVPVKSAADYIFGYTAHMDVSDRGGRGDRKMGGGPDWLVQKNHDTFGPIGPFIVPKEFMPDPMNIRHYFTLNGEVKQDSNTGRMEYNLWEMLSYASNNLTLRPGDLIALGSPSGTNIERDNPVWIKPGDIGTCVVEGIGEQRHRFVAQP